MLNTGPTDSLFVFDPESGMFGSSIDLSTANPGVDFTGGIAGIRDPNALVISSFDGRINEIDPVTGIIATSFTPQLPMRGVNFLGIAVVESEILLGTTSGSSEFVFVYDRGGNFLRSLTLPEGIGALGGFD